MSINFMTWILCWSSVFQPPGKQNNKVNAECENNNLVHLGKQKTKEDGKDKIFVGAIPWETERVRENGCKNDSLNKFLSEVSYGYDIWTISHIVF